MLVLFKCTVFIVLLCEPLRCYSLIRPASQLMGLAVYNSIILDIHFPSCCYKKLLSPAVVPYQNPNARVGLPNLGIDDLAEVMPVRTDCCILVSNNLLSLVLPHGL